MGHVRLEPWSEASPPADAQETRRAFFPHADGVANLQAVEEQASVPAPDIPAVNFAPFKSRMVQSGGGLPDGAED